ncbi:alpha/beta hydrolase family protein [Natronomonas marina]|jgi:hypothetical protein|uniref:alpha/beta hydrolase family protein n=1 Tax=Natronomonas marina TaxID=2961939 RepID=UPI0020C9B7EB|nr:lysophospholipase [Natronomonas marina]
MRRQYTRRILLRLAATAGIVPAVAGGGAAATAPGADLLGLDGDEEWLQRELRNYAKTREAPAEQASDSGFMRRWQERSRQNGQRYAERVAEEPGWRSHANLCATWSEQCTGDPDLYRDVDERGFYGTVGERRRVAFYDRQGARLSGHLWTPTDAPAADGRGNATSGLPGVVITNGSVQAPEPLYWWAAQSLVAAGYVVLTYDPRGQGRSDSVTPDGQRGGNADGEVFVTNQVDAVDFFRSTPDSPYAPNAEYDRGDGAPVEPYNPVADRLDRSRVGIAGHSAGAIGASIVQGLDPWPTGGDNPVGAVVAWDNLGESDDIAARRPEREAEDIATLLETVPGGEVEPRVPAMGQSGDYFLTPRPHVESPDPDARSTGFAAWRDDGVPAYQLVVRGGTHYEWSRTPTFPATSWGFGNALADHYTVAWFDRWLKEPDEPGYGDADDRLLADDEWGDHLSFHYRSKRAFDGRNGRKYACEDVRDGCDTAVPGEQRRE